MRHSWQARATLLFLVAGILGGGSGAPVLDALLYHGDPSHSRPVVHVEPQGTRYAHGDQCTLGWLLGAQPSRSSAPEPFPTAAPELVETTHSSSVAPLAFAFLSSQHSRAPPARSA